MVTWEQYSGAADNWDALVADLNGGFYQTYGWGEVRRVAGWQPLRMIAKRSGNLVGAAGLLVKRKHGVSVCWIPGGPVGIIDAIGKGFRKALSNVLRTRLLYCRMSLLRVGEPKDAVFLVKAGWKRPSVALSSGLSMAYSLAGSEEDRMNRTSGNWRHNLKRSGRFDMRIEHWEKPDPVEISGLYREMESLKSLPTQHTEAELVTLFEKCNKHIVTYRCLDSDGNLLAVRAAGLCGSAAMDLLAVAGKAARKVYASHATLWALLDHCSKTNVTEYDLSGVDPIGNKGVFDFKHGTGAVLVQYLGEWEWASIPGLRYAANLMLKRSAP